jgi:hypothetical protein
VGAIRVTDGTTRGSGRAAGAFTTASYGGLYVCANSVIKNIKTDPATEPSTRDAWIASTVESEIRYLLSSRRD